jgi:ABC-2 type transport system permease protein/ribosome-dependent ATPase
MIIPTSSLSAIATVIAHLLPGMYYTEIVIGAFLKGVGFATLWSNLLILGLYACALFCAGLLAFSKRPAG